MNIVQKQCIGKLNNEEINEDGLYISDKLIVVIDGATSFGDARWEQMKSGAYIRRVLMETLPLMDPSLEAADFLEVLNSYVQKQYQDVRFYEENPSHRLTASILIYNDVRKEIWQYGDCPFSIDGQSFNLDKQVDTLFATLRSFLLAHAMLEGKTYEQLLEKDVALNVIQPLIDKQMLFQNTAGAFGYPAIDGIRIEPTFINIQPVKEGQMIILASDGYPVLEETLEKSEDTLAKYLKEDPLCFTLNPSTKGLNPTQISFDDRTYIRFTV